MQKRKIAAIAGVTLLSAAFLAACGNGSSSSKSEGMTYSYVYTEDPSSLDYLKYSRQQISDLATNAVDGLLEYDKYGNLVPSLAEDWKASADGKTYTYTLREGVKWYTFDGEEYGDVTAEDFVTALKYAADNESEALYIVQDSVAGLNDYIEGKVDFDKVGIKALDERTVQYTLNQPESFWNSKTTMSVMLPVNAEFVAGGDFGKASPDGLLYNGAYTISAMTSKSSIELTKNEEYWDADKVKISDVKLTFYDGNDPESLIEGFKSGNYSTARVFPNSSSYSAVKEQFGENIYYGLSGSSTYYSFFNLNRSNFDHTSKDATQQESAKKALLNKDFRRAIAFGFDRQTYLAQNVGKDASDKALRNMIVPDTFVSAGGKNFGQLTEEKLVTYGDEWKDVDLSDGQNGLYNQEKAKAEFAKAKSALEAEGVTFPVHLDMPVNQTSATSVAQAQSMKQSIEASLGAENVVIDLQMVDEDTFQNMAYYTESADQNDYDISYAGWGPDYQDPSTYLDILDPEKGANIDKLGVTRGKTEPFMTTVGLDKYKELLDAAASETADVNARYAKYAEAQAWLTDSALAIPYQGAPGGAPVVSKLVPFTGAYAWVGIKGSETFKNLEVGTEPVKAEDIYKKREEWQKEKTESNAKAQEELADHVEK